MQRLVSQQRIDRGIDAAHKKAGNTGHACNFKTGAGAAFQTRHKGPGNRFVGGNRKQQGNIDIDSVGNYFFHRRNSFKSTRNLNHQVRPIHCFPQPARFTDGGRFIVCQKRTDFEAYKTIAPGGAFIYRAQHIGRILDVANCNTLIDRHRRH